MQPDLQLCRLLSGRIVIALAAAALTAPVAADTATPAQQAYIKASNTRAGDVFGIAVAVSGDTMVVGAPGEDSNATGVNGAPLSGAVYVFVRNGPNWIQQAYLKASNTGAGDEFGSAVAVSGDTLVVGAHGEDSNAAGVNGNQNDDSATDSGAAYVFVRSGTNWSQQAYLKASNPGGGFPLRGIPGDSFGISVAVSGDTVVVGARSESSSATGVNGNQSDDSAKGSGAAYVFMRSGMTWSQQAYLKASNTGGGNPGLGVSGDSFGAAVAVSGDTAIVSAVWESSNATGVNGNQSDDSAQQSGAAYVFVRHGTNWTQQAYLKASNTRASDFFGWSVAVSGDTAVVGGGDNSAPVPGAGAGYVFVRNGTNWSQRAYLKASNAQTLDFFGWSVAVSDDTVVVGASHEDSNAIGVNGDQSNSSEKASGAAYVFVRIGTNWSQQAYLKASNTESLDGFGWSVAVSGDTVVVGSLESSSATGINGDQSDNSASQAGAVYVFIGAGIPDSDGDGVPNADDVCPNTPTGAIVDATGCSLEQQVPCEAPWPNHGAYLRALSEVSSRFVEAGLLTEAQRRAILQQGAMSDCGKR